MRYHTRLTRSCGFIVALASFSVLIAPVRASSALLHDVGHSRVDSGRVLSEVEPTEALFTGRVVDAHGNPAARAIVVTSAGGRAVTQADGSFELHVRLPSTSTCVQVTAVAGSGRGSCAASTRVSTPMIAGAIATGTLALEPMTSCQPSWLPTFGGAPGVSAEVDALLAFDDGSGPALYAGGAFTTAGGAVAKHVAKWNGSSWSALGGGMSDYFVAALAAFDDGSGPALYAGGFFPTADDAVVHNIAKWNGSSWVPVGSGTSSIVLALTVFDDGHGPALYAAGNFQNASGVAVNNIARWDGSTWSDLAGGMNSGVYALTVFDDGSGSALYAGGYFTLAGGVAADRIAKWDGSSWFGVGGGVDGGIHSLSTFDDGGGPALYAGGVFTNAGGLNANRIAKWDGSSWSPLGSGIGGPGQPVVNALTAFDDGSGPALYAGGAFLTSGGVEAFGIAKWNGSSWSQPGSGMSSSVAALAVFDDGSGPRVYAGGLFVSADGVTVNYIAKEDAPSWAALGSGLSSWVAALAVFDDGSGPALYAGSVLVLSGLGSESDYIAKWNGTSWVQVGSGIHNEVLALTVFDDGGGPALYAGGKFTSAGGVAANYVAKWNGSSWSPLGSGTSTAYVSALVVFDDGGGPALYAGGSFVGAGGVAANRIARWNGTAWSKLGSGVDNSVYSLAVYDDGSGSALYAGGDMASAGGFAANRIAKWNGSSWSALGSGLNNSVAALAAFDDGSGPALYAGGAFTSAGGTAVNNIAKWNGSIWSSLGTGVNSFVDALAVYDDGSGLALYVGGNFTSASGVAANRVARWSGSTWSPLGSGMNAYVRVLTVVDDVNGSVLCAGGDFASAIDSGDSYVAEWGNPQGCGMPGSSICEPGLGSVITCPCANAPAAGGFGCNNSSNTGGAQLSATGIARLSYDTVVFATSGEEPTATSIVLQGDNASAAGVVFGQGVRCVAGSLKRMYSKTAASGSITAPQGADPHVHARSAALGDTIVPGTHRYYGVYYRDPTVLGGCPAASTFNITQQLDVLWAL